MAKKSSKSSGSGLHFLGVLVVFAGFSLYALTSFFSSTNNQIDRLYTSALDAAAPSACYTCPPFPVCDPVCAAPAACYTCPPFPICDPVCGEEVNEDVEPYPVFTDLMSNEPNARAIEILYNAGIVNGHQDGSVKPDNSVNRAELWVVLLNAVDADISGNLSNCFPDVADQWFAPFVCYAFQQGWVSGNKNGLYNPGGNLNKASAAKVVLETFGFTIPEVVHNDPFQDVLKEIWYAPYAEVMRQTGLVDGNWFSPAYDMKRRDFFQMVYDVMVYQNLL